MRYLLALAVSTLSLVFASPWESLVTDLSDSLVPASALSVASTPSVRYASTPCTCTANSASSRSSTTAFKSQEGYGFTVTTSLSGDCINPVTSMSLTASSQSLTQAQFFVQYDGQCPITQDCSQVRCEAKASTSTGSPTLSCSFSKPPGFTNKMYLYMLWQTTSAAGNRQYPLPHPAFIPINLDCAASTTTPSYTSTCDNGVCTCGASETGSVCPTVSPTFAPTVAPPNPTTASTPAPTTTAPSVGNTPTPSQSATSQPTSASTPAPIATTAPTIAPTTAPTGPRLIFNDDFNKLDFSVWEHELTLAGDGNWCFQQYTNNRTNTFIRDGKLYIKPTFTSEIIGEGAVTGNPPYTLDLSSLEPAMQCTGGAFYGCSRTSSKDSYLNPVQSAAIRTAHAFSFKYGRVEVRAKLPRGDWLWPAIWLLPRWAEYGQWPMSGEIDIMESRGNAPGYRQGGNNVMASTLHWGPYFPQDTFELTHKEYTLPAGQSFADSFHTFGLYWDATGLYTYIDTDANRVLSVNWTQTSFYERGGFAKLRASNPWIGGAPGAPFDQEFYLILDVAVGGAAPGFRPNDAGYFAEGPDRPWQSGPTAIKQFWDARSTWSPTWKGDDVALVVDWVRVWQ